MKNRPYAFLYDAQKQRKEIRGFEPTWEDPRSLDMRPAGSHYNRWPYAYTCGFSLTRSFTYDLETLSKITGFTIEQAE